MPKWQAMAENKQTNKQPQEAAQAEPKACGTCTLNNTLPLHKLSQSPEAMTNRKVRMGG